MANTQLSDLINPEVMAGMISATLPKLIKFSPIAHIDNTLVGRPGDTITIPKYDYIGDAEVVAEGASIPMAKLSATTTKVTIHKAGKGVTITDEAILSAYGDPLGEAVRQLGLSIASKIDEDCYTALTGAKQTYDGSAAMIGYTGIVNAVDVLGDENDTPVSKYIFVHPKQLTQIRKDDNFLDINKYPIAKGVIMSGVIGSICGCQVVVSKRVKLNTAGTSYLCPIVVTDTRDPNTTPTADATAPEDSALSIFMKRAVQVETDRDIINKLTVATADEHYAAAITNETKIVLASFKAAA